MDFTVIPDVVCKQTIRSMVACETALSAAQCMSEHDIFAILVIDADGLLTGIVTERDLARRVVAAGKSGADPQLGDIMTAAPKCVAPQDSLFDALELMRDHRVRHVPVVDGDEIVGMVSIRDLVQRFEKHNPSERQVSAIAAEMRPFAEFTTLRNGKRWGVRRERWALKSPRSERRNCSGGWALQLMKGGR